MPKKVSIWPKIAVMMSARFSGATERHTWQSKLSAGATVMRPILQTPPSRKAY